MKGGGLAGNAYVAGDSVAKVDRSGSRVANHGGPAGAGAVAVWADDAGNLFTASVDGAVVKRNAAGRLVATFGSGGTNVRLGA